ncbi:histidine phosphatase family protein [Cytobacillus sp. Hz8]|uniref:histidine phosphatase family protein n=1 Tax=Cytobacillus sp. Hz8 TaxID=3347168 RepID=UPI0035DFA3F8
MNTFIYLVRHGDSPKIGDERTRGLTNKGELGSHRVTNLLKNESINAVLSSPYTRSILTVEKLAKEIGQEVVVYEDLKERIFSAENNRISDKELIPLLEQSFFDVEYALQGGESNADCQKRAIKLLKELLTLYQGCKVVIGTHGLVMTLMLKYYDDKYNLNFLLHTLKPDIYRMEFNGQELVEVTRLLERDDSLLP